MLALCCDYRIMARSVDPARPYAIGLNEVQVGLAAPEGIQRLLRRVVGAHRAERLLVAGEMVPAEQAVQIGLVDELVDGELVVRARLPGCRSCCGCRGNRCCTPAMSPAPTCARRWRRI